MLLYPLALILGAVLAWGCNQLELIPWRRSAAAGAHWTEQARRLMRARVARGINIWGIPICLVLADLIWLPDDSWIGAGICAFVGALLGNFPMDRETHAGLTFRRWAHQVFARLFMSLSTLGSYGVVAALMPDRFGWEVWVIAAGFLALQLGIQFGLGVRLMRALGLLKPAPPRLQALVDETSAVMGIRVRTTWEMTGASANAVAFVVTKDLGFTGKLLEIAPDEEIKAICAHELGHLSETRSTLAVRLAGALGLYPFIFLRPVIAAWSMLGACGLSLLAVFVTMARSRLARRMETRADKIAQENVTEGSVYARALERLYRSNLTPAVLGKSSRRIHPDLYDRMVAAGLTPDYPRPQPPSGIRWTSSALLFIGILLFLYVNLNADW